MKFQLAGAGNGCAPRRRTIDLARKREQRIADGLGVESASAEAPDESVFRVREVGFLVVLAGLLVRARQHDSPMQGLDRPTVGDEPGGKPIEQVGVARRPALLAEVVGRGDQTSAEVMLPDAIDHHARKQGVFRVGHPVGQLAAAALFGFGRECLPAQDLQEALGVSLLSRRGSPLMCIRALPIHRELSATA